jgi:CRISPR-associated protein Cmr5
VSVHTRSQRFAQEAYARVAARGQPKYVSFAKKFPALIHTCGLAQAVAFALAKKEQDYINDLAGVLKVGGPEMLKEQTIKSEVSAYLRLSRDAIDAATWLKRYVEAVAPDAAQEDD